MNLIKSIFTVLGGFLLIPLIILMVVIILGLGYIFGLVILTAVGIYFVKMLYDAVDETNDRTWHIYGFTSTSSFM